MISSTIFLWLISFCCCNFATPIKIRQGVLDGGTLKKSRNGTNFYSFYGIPYAKPPVGELRFEAPQEPDPWHGVRDTKRPPPACIQSNGLVFNPVTRNLTIGQEDCLYLNIFTPNNESTSSSQLRPVFVFFHGGGFQFGSANEYDPIYFMDHDVVFVSVQFRLSIFGFLSAADKALPGNIGMKDQVAALKWIQKNIAAFGGDPKRVTIVGNSSGAASVHFHMYSPLSEGLFHRAVSMSGSALLSGALIPSRLARKRARALGTIFGCESTETETLVNCLKEIPAEDLASSLPNFFDSQIEVVPRPFAVVVEEENEGAFLTKNPWKYNAPNKVPWIVGINADEGCFAVARLRSLKLLDKLLRNYDETFPKMFSYENSVDSTDASNITAVLRKFYFNDRDVDSQKDIKEIIRLYTDAFYAMSTMEAVKRFNWNSTETDTVPVYVYLFDHRNTHSISERFENTTEKIGVCHADDVLSFLYRKFFPPILDGPDLAVSKRLVRYAVNFMNYGDPNGDATAKKTPRQRNRSSTHYSEGNVRGNVWLPVRSSNFEYLHVRTDSDVMEENLFSERYKFWKTTIFPFLGK